MMATPYTRFPSSSSTHCRRAVILDRPATAVGELLIGDWFHSRCPCGIHNQNTGRQRKQAFLAGRDREGDYAFITSKSPCGCWAIA